MKNLAVTFTIIIGTLSTIPVQAGEVSFGYADNGLSLKGIPKTFVKPGAGVKSKNNVSVKALKMRGIQAMGDTKYLEAVSYFKQALAATNDPNEKAELKQYLFTALKIGGNASALNFQEEAITMLNQAIALKPNDYFLHARKGDAYCNMGKLAPCLESHKIAIKLNPDKANGVRHLAVSLVHIDPARSAKTFDLAAKMYSQRGDIGNAKTTLSAKAAFGF